jgi:uncharacterized membrane protein
VEDRSGREYFTSQHSVLENPIVAYFLSDSSWPLSEAQVTHFSTFLGEEILSNFLITGSGRPIK